MKSLKSLVYGWPTKHKEGFTPEEQMAIVKKLGINGDKYNDKLGVYTGMVVGGDHITYHHDVLLALTCVIENREPTLGEWD